MLTHTDDASIKTALQVAGHYSAHIGLAPSFKLTGFLRKYHYHRYASSPYVTATHFAKFFSLHTFASM